MYKHSDFIPGKGAKYCDECFCMSVCLSVYMYVCSSVGLYISNMIGLCPNFTKFSVHVTCGYGSVGPPLTTVQYAAYFRFCGRRHVCPKTTLIGRRPIHSDSPGGSTGGEVIMSTIALWDLLSRAVISFVRFLCTLQGKNVIIKFLLVGQF